MFATQNHSVADKSRYTSRDKSRLRKLQQEARERAEKYGSMTNWTLGKLENIQYFLDRDNFLRYYWLVRDGGKGIKGLPSVAVNRVLYKGTKRMEWQNIAVVAKAFGVLPELLVDEDYYFAKCGVAGYRVVFAAHSKGVSLAELT